MTDPRPIGAPLPATTAADVPLDLGPSLNVDVPDGLQLGARIAAPLDFSAGVDPYSAPAPTKSGVLRADGERFSD